MSLDGDPFDIPIEAVWAFNDLLQENSMARNSVTCTFVDKIVGKVFRCNLELSIYFCITVTTSL